MSAPSSLSAGQTGGAPGAPDTVVGDFVPGGRLAPAYRGGKLTKKEVNFPGNATVRAGTASTWYVTTSQVGALRLPGASCTKPNCECGHQAWSTTGGELDLQTCNVMCEICGLLRADFRISVSNLRRHVREQHLYDNGAGPDIANRRLYSSVKACRTQKPRQSKAKAAEETPAVVNNGVGVSSTPVSAPPPPPPPPPSYSSNTVSPFAAPSRGPSTGTFATHPAQQYGQPTFSFFHPNNPPSAGGVYGFENQMDTGYLQYRAQQVASANSVRQMGTAANPSRGGYIVGRGTSSGHGIPFSGGYGNSPSPATSYGGLQQHQAHGAPLLVPDPSIDPALYQRHRVAPLTARDLEEEEEEEDDDEEEESLFVSQ